MTKADFARAVILVVDDDPGLHDALHVILDDEYQVVDVDDGADALTMIDRRHVDLVLLDLVMPGADGFAALERLNSLRTRIPVIVMSAINTAWTASAAMRLGAVDYLTKPFDDEDLLDLIRHTLAPPSARAPSARAVARPQPVACFLLIGVDLGPRASLAALFGETCRMESARNVAEAIAYANEVSPDLVIVDVAANAGRDVGFVVEIRRNFPLSSFLVLDDTAEAEDQDQRESGAGCVILKKPVPFLRVLDQIRSLVPSQLVRPFTFSPHTGKAIDCVSRDYSGVTMTVLGTVTGISPYYLSRLFRDEVGVTLKNYLTAVRVEVAKSLLSDTRDTIEAIAVSVGFHDAPHLSRTFLEHTGWRPGTYRKTFKRISYLSDVPAEFAEHGERRRRILRRLRTPDLPRHRPPPEGPWHIERRRRGVSEGTVCSGCDERIKPGEMLVDYTYPTGQVVCFHEECERIWDEERKRV